MDNNDLKTKAEQYRNEMMKLYGKSSSEAQSTVSGTDDSPFINEIVQEDVSDISDYSDDDEEKLPLSYSEITEIVAESSDNNYDERFPDPDLSFMDEESGILSDKEANISSPSYQDNLGNSHGFILVNVRTGRDSGVVEGARVVITSLINGARIIMASGVTDISGATQVFELPAPDKSFSQTPTPPVRPYSLFNISVTADGFFNSLSIDVPVFSGITSVQNFNMVPVPLFTEPSSETVIYYNQEPFYDEYASQGG